MTSGGNNFSDLSENQLTKFRAVSPFPLVPISFGGKAFPQKYFGKWNPPSTTPTAMELTMLCYVQLEDVTSVAWLLAMWLELERFS